MGLSGSGVFSTEGRNLASSTISAVVDREAYAKAGLGELEYAHNVNISTKHREFLEKQGIVVPSTTREVSYLSPDAVNAGVLSGTKTAVHEIGHSATKRSGVYFEQAFTPQQLFRDSVASISGSESIDLQKFSEIRNNYLNAMASHGFEEGRAESFSIENIQKGMLKRGSTAENISKSFREDLSGYANPSYFKNYSSRYEKGLKTTLEKLGKNISDIEGPISGKYNLSVEDLLKEITMQGRVKGSGIFSGVLKNVSGAAGKGISEAVDFNIASLRSFAEESMEPIESTRLIGLLDESMELGRGKKVLVAKDSAATARIASQAPASERLIAATDQISSYASRSSNRLFSSAQRASKAVTMGKRGSGALREAGALLSILKARF
jgi:hypothetical protein